MQKAIYEAPDIYWELFCGAGDVIEARFDNNVIDTAIITSCTISTVTCEHDLLGLTEVKRKGILSMAHSRSLM